MRLIDSPVKTGPGATALVSAAAVVVVIYGMQAARAILVPFLVAVFLGVICTPIMRRLERFRVPTAIAVTLVVLLIIGLVTLAGMFVGGSIGEFNERLPIYQQRLDEELRALVVVFDREVSVTSVLETIQPGAAMSLVATLLDALQGLFANFFLIMFTVIFLLLEASSLPGKVQLVMRAAHRDPEYYKRFTGGVQRYLGIKTLISLGTGLAVGLLTFAFGLDFPLLWGLLAFALNYVPNIGSLIAAIPAVLLAFVQLGMVQAVMIAVGYFGINIIIGGVLEPRIMGRGLGLSTLVVFLSLVFWGWVLGPVGMLLSVPLTMTAKIALESSENTAHLALLLGSAEKASSG